MLFRSFQAALKERDLSDEYQYLLYARVFEGMALASNGREAENWTMKMYGTFPQLLPFSDLTMRFRLESDGQPSSVDARKILDGLKNCNIDFDGGDEAPGVSLQFLETGETMVVNFTVSAPDKNRVLTQGSLRIAKDQIEDAGKLLAYRLFGINKQTIGEKPEVVQTFVPAI